MGPGWAPAWLLLLYLALATASGADFYTLLGVRDDATPSQIRKVGPPPRIPPRACGHPGAM